MVELFLDACVACGARDLRRSKLQGLVENLASPLLIPYRCFGCQQRQFKLATIRVSYSTRIAESEDEAQESLENRDVSSAVFPAASLCPQLPDSADVIVPAPLAVRHWQAPAFVSRLAVSIRSWNHEAALTLVRRYVLWMVVAVAGAELVLQTVAIAMWYRNRPTPQHLVLCIRDSYTFGTGATASEFSYPSTLGKLLRKTDQSWQVVNAGWPEHDSRDTVFALSEHLVRYRPARVYIVVGARDSLTRPQAAQPNISKSVSNAFPIAFRTGLLFQDLAKWWRVTSANASESATDWLLLQRTRWNRPSGPSPIGIWLYRDKVVRIRGNGLVRFGEASLRWETKGNQLNLTPANGVANETLHYQWERRKQFLFIKGGIFPTGLLLQPLNDGEARRLEGDAARQIPNSSAAPPSKGGAELEEKLRLAVTSGLPPPARFFVRSNLARTYARNGKGGEATVELAQMRSEMDAAGNPEPMVETYIDTAEFIAEGARALAAAETFAPRYPSNAAIEKTIAWESYRSRDFSSAAAAIDKALSLVGNNSARAAILNMRAQIFLDNNPQKSLESAIEAYKTNSDEFALRSQLQPGLRVYDPELVELSLDNLKASFEVRETVRQAIRELKQAQNNIGIVLAKNLRLMADMVRATGAEVVFVSYPLPEAGRVNEVIRRVSTEKHAGLIDIETVFARHLRISPTKEFFEPDGHLTNKGYGLVADLVAADVSRRKQ